ncbi:hypothetical protein CCZ01_02835 [Helicobacter monodelphidis]|uniref:FAD-dependent oxidoreductase n=1 Tax=Helicobacter sp. 15-1451 TaxID=2004995 RepID=UPI000DCCFED3|nr:FAD-dependent oxidoreductase [Helicobacter sp. 15-1451]RAX58369.1 hypothetical protein CCZ01_02835 [Helicobacter sp. 15-1451]
MKYDTIIIGSGLGGLTCGATLAKNGKKVLVLEQHNLIGGCATCFKRKGMLIDAGLHELDWGDSRTDMKRSAEFIRILYLRWLFPCVIFPPFCDPSILQYASQPLVLPSLQDFP